MSQEILYTSAPKGLKPGVGGYCTVVSTYGMAKNMAEYLESLTAYHHAFRPPDPRASSNPVNYLHLAMKLGGQKYRVLSRIADAGLDYSNRTNKLAHVIALTEKEILACRQGPAEVMAHEGFFETGWDGQLNGRHPGRTLPAGQASARQCQFWERCAGDPGWAGVLAESALSERSSPVSVIFKPGTDTLQLAVEAMGLLPPQLRWKVTFSTYYTNLPAGVTCLWRFVLDETDQAKAVRRNPHLPVIDLCRSLGSPPGGECVEAARSGQLILPAAPEPSTPPVRPSSATPKPGTAAAGQVRQPSGEDGIYDIQRTRPPSRLPQRDPEPSPRTALIGTHVPVQNRPQPAKRARKAWIAATALAAALLLFFGGVLVGVRIARNPGIADGTQMGDDSPPPASVPSLTAEPRPKAPMPVKSATVEPHAVPSEERPDSSDFTTEEPNMPKDDGERVSHTVASLEDDGQETKSADHAAAAIPKDPPTPERSKPGDPFRDVKRWLPLEEIPASPGGATTNQGPLELAKVYVDSPADLELALTSTSEIFENELEFWLKSDDNDNEDGSRNWSIGFDEKTGGPPKKRTLAKLNFQESSLTFAWERNSTTSYRKQAVRLRYCLLEMKAGGKSVRCVLSHPREVEHPAKINFDSPRSLTVLLPVNEETPWKKERVVMDIRLEGFPANEFAQTEGLKFGKEKVIHVFDPASDSKTHFLDIVVKMETLGQNVQLSLEQFYCPPNSSKEPVMRRDAQDAREDRRIEINRNEREITLLDRARPRPPDFAKKRDKFESAKKKAEDNLESAERMLELFNDIGQNGRIHYRVYGMIADEQVEVEIVRTRGFDSPDPKGEPEQ